LICPLLVCCILGLQTIGCEFFGSMFGRTSERQEGTEAKLGELGELTAKLMELRVKLRGKLGAKLRGTP